MCVRLHIRDFELKTETPKCRSIPLQVIRLIKSDETVLFEIMTPPPAQTISVVLRRGACIFVIVGLRQRPSQVSTALA